jgi:ATP-dependent Zn protease
MFQKEQVSEFYVDGLNLKIITKDDKTVEFKLRSVRVVFLDFSDIYNKQKDEGIIKKFDFPQEFQPAWWMSMLPYLAFMVLIVIFWFFIMNQSQGGGGKVMSFGKSRLK